MNHPACPDQEARLEALLFGELPGNDREELERHLARCEGCREALSDARLAYAHLSAIETPPLPYELSGDERSLAERAWEDLRSRLPARVRVPERSFSWAAMAAMLLAGIGLGRLFVPAASGPGPAESTIVDHASLEALERAELLADVGVRYADGLRRLLGDAAELSLEAVSEERLAGTRERALSLLRDGHLLERALDPEQDRLFLQSIARAEPFLEELAALAPPLGEGSVRQLQASLRRSRLAADLDRLELDRKVESALRASGGLALESGFTRKDF